MAQRVMADKGKAAFSYMLEASRPRRWRRDLPRSRWHDAGQSRRRDVGTVRRPHAYAHDGLKLPDNNDGRGQRPRPRSTSISPRQKLTVGVYRETDDEPGFSNYQSKVAGGDQRPSDDVSKELMVELMSENSRGRLTKYEYKAFDKDGERTVEVSNPMSFDEGSGQLQAPARGRGVHGEVPCRLRTARPSWTWRSSRNGRDVDTYGDDLEDGTSVGWRLR